MQKSTIAQTIAALLNEDGQQFETEDGRTLIDLCDEHDAKIEYAVRVHSDDPEPLPQWVAGFSGDHFSGDPVRYEFPDGSAIVAAGDGWDFEGDEPFSWAGA